MAQKGWVCFLVVAVAISLSVSVFAEASSMQKEEEICAKWGSFGTMAIGRKTISISDTNRANRTLTVDVWYPAVSDGEALTQYIPLMSSEGRYVALDDPKVAAPSNDTDNGFPLLIFSHGYGGIRQQSAKLMEHLASWGFVVASPDHAGNSQNDPAGADIPFNIIFDRPKDITFVIDSMLSAPYIDEFHLHENVDRGVGVLGHSYGGLTSLLVAPDGILSDGRVKAIMPIAPAVYSADNNFDYLSKVKLPLLVIGGANDTITPADPNNIMAFEETSGLPRWNLVLRDAGHYSFADLCWIFDALESVFNNEDAVYSLLGGGDVERGKRLIAGSYCETFDVAQTILGYYAVAFFQTMLSLGDDDNGNEEIVGAKKCMAEQADSFHLATFEFLDNLDDNETKPIQSPTRETISNVTDSEPTQSPTRGSIANITEKESEKGSEASSAAFSIKLLPTVTQLLASYLMLCASHA